MSINRIQKIFNECEAIGSGHFEFDSGLHGAKHFEKRNIIKYPKLVYELCNYLTENIINEEIECDLVCSPAVGGLLFGYMVAFHLNKPFIFVEYQHNKKLSIRKNFIKMIKDARILFIDDNKTTGKTINECSNFIQSFGGKVVHAGFIVEVKDIADNIRVSSYTSLISFNQSAWEKVNCPLCEKNIPLTDRSEISGVVINEQEDIKHVKSS